MLVSILDSYVSYVMKRLQVLQAKVEINGELVLQPFGGIVTVQDWPQTPVTEGSLYLIMQSMTPGRRQGGSKSQRQYILTCQWTWLLIGADIAPDEQAQNRGDRYRSNMQMMQNLKEANFPGFCQKMDYGLISPDAWEGTAVPAQSKYPVSRTERIVWDELSFMPKHDNSTSGVLYNAASVTIAGWEDTAAAQDITFDDTRGPQIA